MIGFRIRLPDILCSWNKMPSLGSHHMQTKPNRGTPAAIGTIAKCRIKKTTTGCLPFPAGMAAGGSHTKQTPFSKHEAKPIEQFEYLKC